MTQMLNKQMARSYAIALYELDLPSEDIQKSRELIESCPELMTVLVCPVVALDQKLACVERIFPENIRTFIKVVCSHQRCALLRDIFICYEEYVDEMGQVLNAVIRCVTPPDDRQLSGIRQFLAGHYKAKEVRIRVIKDPSLIGGFIIEADGCEFDYSIRGRFDQLEQQLIRR